MTSQVAEKLASVIVSYQGTTSQPAEKVGFRVELAFRPASKSFIYCLPSGL
jgi:hypothetical protein